MACQHSVSPQPGVTLCHAAEAQKAVARVWRAKGRLNVRNCLEKKRRLQRLDVIIMQGC